MPTWIIAIIPDEWISAFKTWRYMLRAAGQTPRATTKHLIGLGCPFVIGLLGFWPFRSAMSADFIQGFLTVIGVLAGFVVTLMLFTGSSEGTDTLDHDQTKVFADKVMYLLFSQTMTLATYLFAIIVGAAWLFSFKATYPSAHPSHLWLAPIVLGSGVVAICRTALLPAQIYECHDFVMDAIVKRKAAERNASIRKSIEMLNEPAVSSLIAPAPQPTAKKMGSV
jgi:hypothetical protein